MISKLASSASSARKTPTRKKASVDLVIPIFNEEAVIGVFHERLSKALKSLPYQFKVIYVNDGSTDRTQSRLQEIAKKDKRVEVIEFSRNFGHQAALTAGLDHAESDFVISLDGDGQHPPELIGQMLEMAEDGAEVVLTRRLDQENLSVFKRMTSGLFYKMVNRIGDTYILPGGADFRLLAHAVVVSLRQMPEYHRFLRGMVAWTGFKTAILEFAPAERMAGESKYTTRKMMNLAVNAIFSFSLVPLYISISIGILFFILALVEAIYVLSFWFSGRQSTLEPGWSSLMFMLLIIGGCVLTSLGIIGLYIGYIFQEVKHRPVYLIRSNYP
jgi:glycosyltransferase involved in cell wall biosynthesis